MALAPAATVQVGEGPAIDWRLAELLLHVVLVPGAALDWRLAGQGCRCR